MTPLRLRYLGCLALLGECAVFVPEDIRGSIERAMVDAEEDGLIEWRRIINRIEVSIPTHAEGRGA